MEIAGLQKLTLIDYPGRVACSLFLYGCNFRCGFCHNPELVVSRPPRVYSEDYILMFLEERGKYLEGVCISGGEPLLNLDTGFLKKIKGLGYFIKIDTNGSFPNRLKELVDNNLVDYVSMDVKASKENYEKVCSSKVDMASIEKSIKIISGLENYEFRTTVFKRYHDETEIKRICEWIKGLCQKRPKKYCLQGFKNNGKFVDNSFKNEEDTEESFLKKLKLCAKDYFEEVEIRV